MLEVSRPGGEAPTLSSISPFQAGFSAPASFPIAERSKPTSNFLFFKEGLFFAVEASSGLSWQHSTGKIPPSAPSLSRASFRPSPSAFRFPISAFRFPPSAFRFPTSHLKNFRGYPPAPKDTLIFKGQLISWANLNPANELPAWLGGRYLPQLNYNRNLPENRLFDIEASANLFGNVGLHPFDTAAADGDIRPYRLWARYSAPQFEFRLGLQKINFGSASLLRPLMWFDQVDPRDPIQFTDGVWGALGRYYFLNNANIWLWGLYGNNNPKGWEFAGTSRGQPEFGGRVQYPIPHGEAGFSFHRRKADTRGLNGTVPAFEEAPENRFGLDLKLDLVVGCWLEASWVTNNQALEEFTNQELINVGVDYTFGVGNGLYAIFEQLLISHGQEAFSFDNTTTLSLLSLSYPIGLFDNLGAIVYIDWANGKVYNFVNWTIQFDRTALYVMGYWNPKDNRIPTQNSTQNLYSGVGVQLLFLFNH